MNTDRNPSLNPNECTTPAEPFAITQNERTILNTELHMADDTPQSAIEPAEADDTLNEQETADETATGKKNSGWKKAGIGAGAAAAVGGAAAGTYALANDGAKSASHKHDSNDSISYNDSAEELTEDAETYYPASENLNQIDNPQEDDVQILTSEGYSDIIVEYAQPDAPAYTAGIYGHHEHQQGGAPLYHDVPVAESVNDNMTFAQAFAAARQEVGPGGVFEWHGQVYGTYTASEWAGMSEAEQNQFAHNSAVSYGHYQENLLANQPAPGKTPYVDFTPGDHGNETAQNDINDGNSNDGQLSAEDYANAVVGYPAGQDITDTTAGDYADAVVGYSEDVTVIEDIQTTEHIDHTGDVTVHGVYHDDETNTTMGFMNIDNEEVVLLDVDNDDVFDLGVIDLNQDGQVQEEEIFDITDAGITVSDLENYADPGLTTTGMDEEILPCEDDFDC